MIFRNIRPVDVNNGRWAAILNFIDLKFFEMHPLLKPYNLFYSNGVAILRSASETKCVSKRLNRS